MTGNPKLIDLTVNEKEEHYIIDRSTLDEFVSQYTYTNFIEVKEYLIRTIEVCKNIDQLVEFTGKFYHMEKFKMKLNHLGLLPIKDENL